LQPDAVVMDVAMPQRNWIEVTRRITGSFPAVKVLALILHRDRSFVEGMLAKKNWGAALPGSDPAASFGPHARLCEPRLNNCEPSTP
jgi:DNA-binding NarL/FixJ family response regulator